MDLKDVIANGSAWMEEAFKAFNAGHRDVAERYLGEIEMLVKEYFIERKKTIVDVTESATREKPAETQTEKPAEVPGAQVRPAAFVPVKLAQQAQQVPESQQETR